MRPSGNFFDAGPGGNSTATDPVVILGAGLTGLSAAHHLARGPFVLVEQHDRVGGHARSEREQGHTFDVTGHWLHLRDDRCKALLASLFAPGEWASVARKTKIATHGVELEYPFQANLHGLPVEVVHECLVGLLAAREALARGEAWAREPKTFAEFARARFGAGIARHFFVPYNGKLWGTDIDALAPEWIARFIPVPEPAQILAGALGLVQRDLGYNAEFLYPKAGGIDALPEALRRAIEGRCARGEGELRTSCAVEEVDVVGKRVKLSGVPDWTRWRALVSTIPLPELIARIPAAPPEVRADAAALRWVRWHWLDVATATASPRDWHWAYVPEPRFPFFRVGVYSNAMPSMAPPGAGSLYVELDDRDAEPDLPSIAAGLVEIGALARVEDIRFTRRRKVEYAYVMFDEAHAAATARLLAWLEGQGVRSCGRYGAWIYNSMEDSLLSGLAAAQWAEGRHEAAAATESVARREGPPTKPTP